MRAEVYKILGDSKLRNTLGQPEYTFETLMDEMIDHLLIYSMK